nr:NUDIX domain-containing protein [Aquibacillus albus]
MIEQGKIYLLFQHRHPQKDLFPNLLDISAAGHLLSGETPEDGVREVEEELGLKVEYSDLISVGIFSEQLVGEAYKDFEHCHVFLYEFEGSIHSFDLQEEEVTGLVKIPFWEWKELIEGRKQQMRVTGFQIKDNQKIVKDFTVKKQDFVPHQAEYYQMICDAVEAEFAK